MIFENYYWKYVLNKKSYIILNLKHFFIKKTILFRHLRINIKNYKKNGLIILVSIVGDAKQIYEHIHAGFVVCLKQLLLIK